MAWANGGPKLDLYADSKAEFAGSVSTVWEITKAGPTIARMPLRERMTCATLHNGIANQQNVIQTERADVVRFTR